MRQKSRQRKKQKRKAGSGLWGRLGVIGIGAGLGLVVIVFLILGVRLGVDYVKRDWEITEPYRVVLIDESGAEGREVVLVQVDYDDNQVSLVRIPGNIMVEVAAYGWYRLETLNKLAQVENLSDDDLAYSLSISLGRRVNAVMRMDVRGKTAKQIDRAVGWRLLNHSIWRGGNLYESLMLDIKMGWDQSVRVDDLAIEADRVVEEVQDVDGYVLKQLNKPIFDSMLNDTFGLPVPVRNEFSLVVENNTGVSGLARQWARVLNNDGFDVVGEVTSEEELDQSVIWVKDNEMLDSGDILVLKRILPIERVGVNDKVGEYRSEVVVKLGNDVVN